MQKRFVFGVSCILFSLLGVVTFMFADLLDRSFPVSIGARSVINMDFSIADIEDREALASLAQLSDKWDLGLVKVLPVLGEDTPGEVFAKVGASGPEERSVPRFGASLPSRVEGNDALVASFADGRYLLTGERAGDQHLREWARSHGVVLRWEDRGVSQVVRVIWSQAPFVISTVAALCLMNSLVLFWMAAGARSRSLRVLAGAGSRRIVYEDIGSLLWVTFLAAVVVLLPATAWVEVRGVDGFGWFYGRLLAFFELGVLAAAAVLSLLVLAVSWPSATALATRSPTAAGLKRVAAAATVANFALLLFAVGPTLQARAEATTASTQQSKWRGLADEVVLSFPAALGEAGFQRVRDRVAGFIHDADRERSASLSYALTADTMGLDEGSMGGADVVAVVNSRWLEMMQATEPSGRDALVKIQAGQLPPAVTGWLNADLTTWVKGRTAEGVDEWWRSAQILRYEQSRDHVPFALAGNGDLTFPDVALVFVVDDLAQHYDADFLASLATSRNITFDGLDRSVRSLSVHGLRKDLQVRYMAEAGILRAQFAAYSAWLCQVAILALIAATGLAIGVGALVSGLLSARQDFAVRLSGATWFATVRPRVARQLFAGTIVSLLIIASRWRYGALPMVGIAVAAGVLLVASHVLVARWTFVIVRGRRL